MKRINLLLSDIEEQNLNALVKKYGGKHTSFLKILIKEAFEKEYGGYKSRMIGSKIIIPGEELTKEQICEMLGGTVHITDAGPVCRDLTLGQGASVTAPLSMMGEGKYKI